jgi:hypothetical protein
MKTLAIIKAWIMFQIKRIFAKKQKSDPFTFDQCDYCLQVFYPNVRNQRFCCKACRYKWHYEIKKYKK